MTPREQKNRKRAARARKAIRAYMGCSPCTRLTGETAELAIVDLLTDMMHLANHAVEREFSNMYISAVGHFKAEERGE